MHYLQELIKWLELCTLEIWGLKGRSYGWCHEEYRQDKPKWAYFNIPEPQSRDWDEVEDRKEKLKTQESLCLGQIKHCKQLQDIGSMLFLSISSSKSSISYAINKPGLNEQTYIFKSKHTGSRLEGSLKVLC